MSIVLLDGWTEQPPYLTGINPDFGIPIFAYDGRVPYDQCVGAIGTYVNSAGAAVTPHGVCLSTYGETVGRLTFQASSGHNLPNGPWSIYVYLNAGSIVLDGGYNNPVFGRDGGTDAGKWYFTLTNGGGDTAIYFYQGQSGGISAHRWGVALNNRGLTRLCISRPEKSATKLKLWLDGVPYGDSTVSGQALGTPLSGVVSVEIGSNAQQPARGLRAAYYAAVLTQGVPVTDILAKKFSDNPWQLFAP